MYKNNLHILFGFFSDYVRIYATNVYIQKKYL